jgi:hypothetical protein
MIPKKIASFAIILLLTIPPGIKQSVPHSRSIRVRILDASTEKPLPGIKITLALLDDPRIPRGMVNGTADSNGIVVLDLPYKVPMRLGPRFAPDYVGLCSDVEFETARILNTGVVGKNNCKNAKPNDLITAGPGELVIFAMVKNPWLRLLRELF